jgi:hypothetical protein
MTTKLQGKIGGVDVELKPEICWAEEIKKSIEKDWHKGKQLYSFRGDVLVRVLNAFLKLVKADPAKATGEREPVKARLMICNHAAECTYDGDCLRKVKHSETIMCHSSALECKPHSCRHIEAFCVPYVEAKPPVAQAKNAKVDPGEGYRLLDMDEIIQEGDECLFLGNKWDRSADIGMRVKEHEYMFTYRRRVESVAQAGKDEGHTSCVGYKDEYDTDYAVNCRTCHDFDYVLAGRKNWTPQPPKGKYAIKDNAQKYWENVYLHCQKLGMQPKTGLTGEQDVLAFIRDLHRDSETYKTHREIWLKECESICDALEDLAELPHHPRPGWKTCINKIKQREWEKKYSILEITFFIRNLYTRKNAETIDYITKMLEHPKYGISALNRRE